MAEKPTLNSAPVKGSALTPVIIADLAPGEERGDAQCRGLRVRGLASGKKVFFYRYRGADGALREIRLGYVGPLTLAKARDAALKLRVDRDRGKDPQLEKRLQRLEATRLREEERKAAYTITKMCEEYFSEALPNLKRGCEAERLLRVDFMPSFGDMPAAELTKRQLQDEVIRPKMLKYPRTATQLLSRIRCAYAHAIEQGRLPEDFIAPTVGIKSAAAVRRKRALSDAELATFLKWLPNSPYSRNVRDSLRLVLLTGCRSGEIVAGRWCDIDLDRGIWTMRETKNGEPYDVMLSRQGVELLEYRTGLDQQFVFPSPRPGKHIAQKALGLAQYTARHMDEESGGRDPIAVPWTVHDLRRTVATGLAKLGCSRVVQDRILNHIDNSVSAIYDRHTYDIEARGWLQKWADHMDRLLIPKVIPITAAKAA
jgi:integrase